MLNPESPERKPSKMPRYSTTPEDSENDLEDKHLIVNFEEVFVKHHIGVLSKCHLLQDDPGAAFQFANDLQIHQAMGLASCPAVLVQGATPVISAAAFKQYISNIVFAIIPANQSGVEISDPGAAVPMYADNIFQHMSAENFANLVCTINSRTNVLWCTDCIANGMTCGVFFQVSDAGFGRNRVDRICPLGPIVGL